MVIYRGFVIITLGLNYGGRDGHSARTKSLRRVRPTCAPRRGACTPRVRRVMERILHLIREMLYFRFLQQCILYTGTYVELFETLIRARACNNFSTHVQTLSSSPFIAECCARVVGTATGQRPPQASVQCRARPGSVARLPRQEEVHPSQAGGHHHAGPLEGEDGSGEVGLFVQHCHWVHFCMMLF